MCFADTTVQSLQSLSRVRLSVTPWTAARQASLSITNSQSLLKLMSWRSFLYSSVYYCRLFLISSVSVRSIPFLSFSVLYWAHLCMKCSLGISNFLEEIYSLFYSLLYSVVFLYFFALITEEGFLISPCYSLELCIQMGISLLFSFAFRFFFSQLFIRPPQTTILLFCICFSWGWSRSLSPECDEPLSIVHQALYHS